MRGFEVETERIAATGTGVQDAASALGTEIAAMHRTLAQIQAGWRSSEAAPRFATAMLGHLEQVEAMRDALVGQGVALAGTATRMAQAEASLAASLGGGR